MPFESLAYRYTFNIPDFPDRWLPLIYLYDPDLPLFPIYYFHVLSDRLSGERPLQNERAYGYVEKIYSAENSGIDATVVTNKNLDSSTNENYRNLVINEIRERFGLVNSVTQADVSNVFSSPLNRSNAVLSEIWQRVVANAYGNRLPFGRLWDGVLGLTRYVASWYSPHGRKGELIQTHYFASKFGVNIQSAGGIPQIDFNLLPTISELTVPTNPLTYFPEYANIIHVARQIQNNYCTLINVSGINLSRFNNPSGGNFNTRALMSIFNGSHVPAGYRPAAIECFNSFDKGPVRPIIFLMMLDDIRRGRLDPAALTSSQCGSIYDGLSGTYQSPKVIELYAQQSFGNTSAMPMDSWMKTFFKWPLNVLPTSRTRNKYNYVFSHAQNLGKVERMLWVAGQARKVHSSACNDALWCLKYSSDGKPRGANPLACNICLSSIRNCCPAYDSIRGERICFNTASATGVNFVIETSANNNTTPSQTFVNCTGKSIYNQILDDFSPADNPSGFAPYPDSGHNGTVITVDRFVHIY